MSLWELFVIAVGLSMDAFGSGHMQGTFGGAGQGKPRRDGRIYFGGFQMLMPLLGYRWGCAFKRSSQEWTTGSPSSCWG